MRVLSSFQRFSPIRSIVGLFGALTIRQRLFLLGGLAVLFTLAIAIVGVAGLNIVGKRINDLPILARVTRLAVRSPPTPFRP